MTTTMSVYEQIQRSMEKGGGKLTVLLRQLHDQVNMSNQSLKVEGKDSQQILAQVYSHLQRPIAKLKRQINSIIPSQLDLPQQLPEVQMEEEIAQEDGSGEQEMPEQQQDDGGEYVDQDDIDDNMEGEEMDALMDDEQDVGLYGEQLDEDMQSYENEGSDENIFEAENEEMEGEEDNIIEDNFDHFRQVELKNDETDSKQQKSKLQTQINRLEQKAMNKKDWMVQGEVKAKERPINSLLQHDLQFNSGLKYQQQVNEEHNTELQKIIRQRILDELFDDRTRYLPGSALREHFGSLKDVSTQKSEKGLAQLYELEFKNYLGLGENKNDRIKKQIMESFKQINYYLDSLSNLNFTPKPTPSRKSAHRNQQAVISQEKVPITLWEGDQESRNKKVEFESHKEVDKKAKRLKNKRISKQRKKEQDRKKLNKKIEYGGMTKYHAQVKKKIIKNKKDQSGTKYSKSASFFKQMNQKNSTKAGKPNPNLNKMKI